MQRCRQKCLAQCLKRSFGYKNDARKSSRSIPGDLWLAAFWDIFRILVEIWAEKNFEKKTFFSRHVQKWNNNFEKNLFLKFSIFLKFFFSEKCSQLFSRTHFFREFFFSTVYFFLTRSKTPSYINVWSEEVAEKCTWKSRFRRSSPINTLIKCSKRLQVANLQESTWNFFERHFYTQKNVLNTEPGISDDIAALWKSLVTTGRSTGCTDRTGPVDRTFWSTGRSTGLI